MEYWTIVEFSWGRYFHRHQLFQKSEETVMVRVNVLEGIKPPLPPPTPREILEVCLAALGFCAATALFTAGIIALLNFLFF